MQDPVLIIGAGNTGRIVADIFDENGVLIYGFLDDNNDLHEKEINGVVVLGNTDDNNYLKIVGNKTEVFIAIKNKEDRKSLIEHLGKKRKVMPVNAIHPTSSISKEAVLEHGILIGAQSNISAGAVVKSHCFINASSHIGVGATLESFVEIGSRVSVGDQVTIEEGAFIGDGVVIVSGVTIGKNARVGAGSVVVSDVKSKETVFGNPAQKV